MRKTAPNKLEKHLHSNESAAIRRASHITQDSISISNSHKSISINSNNDPENKIGRKCRERKKQRETRDSPLNLHIVLKVSL